MRLFVAVDLSPEALAEAARVVHAIRERRGSLDVRWVSDTNMHLTIRFIGHVAERVEELVAAVTEPVPFPPFDITLGGCGAFPPSGAARVIWIGLAAGTSELERLSAVMDERLRPFGVAPEQRGYHPHLTLARAARDKRLPRDVRDTLEHVTVRPATTHVTQAMLYRSHLSPRGPRYEKLSPIALLGGPPASRRS
jgi:2'-5' RNA ligase